MLHYKNARNACACILHTQITKAVSAKTVYYFAVAAVLNRHAVLQQARRGNQRPVPVQEWGRGYMAQLQENWRDYLQMDLANSTHRAYDYHQRQFKEFCRLAELPVKPAPRALAQFVIGRAEHGYALSTIEQGVYAVARWALDLGIENLATDLEVKRAMKVASKLAVPVGRQKLPLDRRDLRRVVDYLAQSGSQDFIGVQDRALFLLGWAGMFRSSELVSIQWADLYFTKSKPGVMVHVPRSKTDQTGEGAWVFVAGCAAEQAMCPVKALQRLQQLYVTSGSGAVGPVFKGLLHSTKALSKTTVGTRLRKSMEQVGIEDWQLYAAHSLRRGGATWAVQQGVSVREVQIMGRWKSDVVREYLYCSPEALFAASRKQQRG